MRRRFGLLLALLAVPAATLLAHDLFLRPEDFYVAPGAPIRAWLLNGSFTKSENAVTRDRVLSIALAGPRGVTHPDTGAWTATGDTSRLSVTAGEAGTYILGAAIRPRELRLEAAEFNGYLASDGLPDVLAERRARGELEKPARERYSKHVKALVQVGDARSATVSTVLGHAAELVPLDNPYALRAGDVIRVRALVDGAAAAELTVLAGGLRADGRAIPELAVRTGADGVAGIRLREPGLWYVKFIRMRRVTGEPAVDYESKWATLTFAVR